MRSRACETLRECGGVYGWSLSCLLERGVRKSKGAGDSHGEDTGTWGMTSKQPR